MAINPDGIIGRFLHQRSLARWRAAARDAHDAELAKLRTQRSQARQLRTSLQDLNYLADLRLGLPRIGSNTFARPAGTDWAWRPQLWRGGLGQPALVPARNKMALGDDLTVFHDCKMDEVMVRQIRLGRDHDLAPFGVSVEMFGFAGSFLSLAISLPPAACEGLQKQHLIQLGLVTDREHPIKMFARLNVKSGPNTENVLLTIPADETETTLDFDLAYSKINERRSERMWIDLMFENPGMNKIVLRDLTICRYPRAVL